MIKRKINAEDPRLPLSAFWNLSAIKILKISLTERESRVASDSVRVNFQEIHDNYYFS